MTTAFPTSSEKSAGMMRFAAGCAPALLLAAVTAGCSSAPQPSLPYMESGPALQALDRTGAGKIEHVVYIVQENRSFDNLFQGYPHADTVSSGKNSKGQTIALRPVGLSDDYIIAHSAEAMFAAWTEPVSCPAPIAVWTASISNRESAVRATASTPTCLTKIRSRISIWRTNGCWPIGCSSRSST